MSIGHWFENNRQKYGIACAWICFCLFMIFLPFILFMGLFCRRDQQAILQQEYEERRKRV